MFQRSSRMTVSLSVAPVTSAAGAAGSPESEGPETSCGLSRGPPPEAERDKRHGRRASESRRGDAIGAENCRDPPVEVTNDEVGQADGEEAEPPPFSMGCDRWMNRLCPRLKGFN